MRRDDFVFSNVDALLNPCVLNLCEEPFEFYTMRSGLWAEVNLGHLRDYFISASPCKMKHARADGRAS